MCYGVLSLCPAPVPVPNSDYEERPPEDEEGPGHDAQHLHPRHPFLLHAADIVLQLIRRQALLGQEADSINKSPFGHFYSFLPGA